jgi:hypothetical protein
LGLQQAGCHGHQGHGLAGAGEGLDYARQLAGEGDVAAVGAGGGKGGDDELVASDHFRERLVDHLGGHRRIERDDACGPGTRPHFLGEHLTRGGVAARRTTQQAGKAKADHAAWLRTSVTAQVDLGGALVGFGAVHRRRWPEIDEAPAVRLTFPWRRGCGARFPRCVPA